MLFLALQPNAHFTIEFSRADVHDSWPAADRAVLGVGLVLAATEVDEQLFGFTAERARDLGAGFLFLQSERKNTIISACSAAVSSSGLP